MKKSFVILFSALLFGCSSNDIEEVNIPVIGPEEHENQVELPEEITFPINEETYTIHLGNIPMLAYYIASTENIEKTINSFKGIPLTEGEENPLILMSYACQETTNNCSYIFIKEESEEKRIIPIADLASYSAYSLSPNGNYVLIHFNRNENLDVYTSHIVAIDLEEMEVLPLRNESLEEDVLHFNYPIFNMEWIENDKIAIEIPNDSEENSNMTKSDENPTIEKQIIEFEL